MLYEVITKWNTERRKSLFCFFGYFELLDLSECGDPKGMGQDSLFFGVVQLPDYQAHHDQANTTLAEEGWAWIRDAQLRASKVVADMGS